MLAVSAAVERVPSAVEELVASSGQQRNWVDTLADQLEVQVAGNIAAAADSLDALGIHSWVDSLAMADPSLVARTDWAACRTGALDSFEEVGRASTLVSLLQQQVASVFVHP